MTDKIGWQKLRCSLDRPSISAALPRFPVRLLRFSPTRCTLGFPRWGMCSPTVGAPLQHWRQHGSVTDAEYFHTVMTSSTPWIQGTNQPPEEKRETRGGGTGGHVDTFCVLTARILDYTDDAKHLLTLLWNYLHIHWIKDITPLLFVIVVTTLRSVKHGR